MDSNKISPFSWLRNHLTTINGLPVLEFEEINDSDPGFVDAQKNTKGKLYEKDSVSGGYNEDTDEIDEHEFEVALSLFVIRKNSENSDPYRPTFIFSSTEEDETEEEFIELAKKELNENDLEEFRKLFRNY